MHEFTFVTSKMFLHDGHSYSIGVYESNAGFMAFCDCHVCPTERMRSELMPTKDAAIEECREKIRGHHSQFHLAS